MSDSGSALDALPWDEIQQISQEGLFEQVFKKIPKSLFRFAAKDKSRQVLIEAAFRSLRKINPNASFSQATLLADIMQTFAKKVTEDKK